MRRTRIEVPPHLGEQSFDGVRPYDQGVDDVRVELFALLCDNRFERGLEGQSGTIRSVRGDGIEDVRHAQDANAQRDTDSRKAVRVSSAIPAFVMVANT